jgi:flagellar hook-associated protein 3 FlgL
MNFVSIGDLAQSFRLRQNLSETKIRQATLTQELSSGVVSDKGAAVRGDHRALAALDRALPLLAARKAASDEAGRFATTIQTAIGTMQAAADAILPDLLSAATMKTPTQVNTLAADAEKRFDAAVSALNAQSAGRYVLSGASTDTRSLAGSDAILTALGTATTGLVTVTDIEKAVSAWFDAPAGGGGFLDSGYLGSSVAAPQAQIDEGTFAGANVTAADPAIREVLKGLALAALANRGALQGDPSGRAALVSRAGEVLADAGGRVVALRAEVGIAEERLSDASTSIAAEISSTKIARSDLVGIDEYETATALTDTEKRIETLFALTARLSRLSLTDWLR